MVSRWHTGDFPTPARMTQTGTARSRPIMLTNRQRITHRNLRPRKWLTTPRQPFAPPYQGEAVNAPVNPQPATTLIFKDGRPPVEIHNYALTANTLYALDGDSRQEIPLSLLNVEATVEANRAAGVDFALPTSR